MLVSAETALIVHHAVHHGSGPVWVYAVIVILVIVIAGGLMGSGD